MRVLITGSSGFIGKSVVSSLISVGHEVVEFDNHSRHGGGGISLDVRDAGAVVEATSGVDAVWHLAAINGCSNFYDRPWDVAEVQIRGTLNVINACIRHGINDLVLFSTSECYQTPPVIPTPENVPLTVPDITNPRYSYGGSKIAAEILCQHCPVERCTTIRAHNVFGANMGYEHVVPQFIMKAARTPDGGEFLIQSPEEFTRSFIYIDDFTDAMMAIWRDVSQREGRVREIFHVGTEDETTIASLAGEIARVMGRVDKNGRPVFRFKSGKAAEGGTPRRCPNVAKLRSLGWVPKVSLREGLEKTVAAYLAVKDQWPE